MTDRMPHGAAIEEVLVKKMRTDLGKKPWHVRWYSRVALVLGSMFVVAGGSIAAVVLLSPEAVTDSFVVHCLSEAKINADGTFPGAAANVSSPDGELPVDDAVNLCRQMWEAGALSGADPLNPTPTPGSAPTEFTTCVTDNGEAAVVPGHIECSVLRLHPYQPNVPEGR